MTSRGPLLSSTLLLISCATVINCSTIASEKNASTNKTAEEEERLDIRYDNEVFKEIGPDTLQLIGDATKVTLECQSTTRSPRFVNWLYHGIEENVVELEHYQNSVRLKKFAEGPPVARMECVDRDNAFISNSTLLYRGDGQPPFLYRSGESLAVTLLNKTTARFPCLVNYPLDALEHVQLQLFKDGEQVDNKNNSLSYTSEHGYTLNLTKLEHPFGIYECRVINLNSTNSTDDYVKMELANEDVVRAEIEVRHQNDWKFFFKGDPTVRIFLCKIPKSMFENRFEWFYLLSNGSYTPVKAEPHKENTKTPAPDPLRYVDSVRLKFSSTDITHVVCRAHSKHPAQSYNNTYAVEVREPKKPKIVMSRSSTDPIFYTEGMTLTCLSDGDPISFNWLKNGQPVDGLNSSYSVSSPASSTLILKPFRDDVDSNYTCVAQNFLGNATSTYRVQIKPDPTPGIGPLVVLGICLAVVLVLLLLLFTFFQVKLERRNLSEEKIQRFFNGYGATDVPRSEFGDEPQEPYESVSYDTTKEININSLNFVRELKGGNFGKVQFGYYRDMSTGYGIPVAIKSIKDDPTASQEDVEFAFENFLKEIKIMQVLGEHPNVVRYIGAVTSDLSRYSAYLVLEYCSEGDLGTYLRSLIEMGGSFHDDTQGLHNDLFTSGSGSSYTDSSPYFGSGSGDSVGSKTGIVLKTRHLIKWAEDIASGMEYIDSKGWVHGDIAARNVLLAYEGRDCNHPDPGMLRAKISDFGLSKDLNEFPKDYYPIRNRNRELSLPLRWMSVETLQTLKFSTKSDVWAFGVTLWEMFTLGKYPYSDLPNSKVLLHALLDYLKQGKILPPPEFAPREIWEIMSSCWSKNPAERPSFKTLKELLHTINENIESQREPVEENLPENTEYSTLNFVENLVYKEEEGSQSEGEEKGTEEGEGE